jgi:cysteine-rich repeat protein
MRTQIKRLSALPPRAQGFVLGFILAALVGAFVSAALSATSNTIRGCYERRGGELRIRKEGTSCKDGEIAISWNKKGRRGPQGEQGEPGLLSSFDSIEGLPCTRGGDSGTIALTYEPSGEAVMTCEVPSTGEVCGDGEATGAEACDDGNANGGDGCTDTCQVEVGYQCTGVPSVCQTACGDGVPAGAEACDDGNTVNGDGCSDVCTIEPSGGQCGDGFIDPAEECDDGGMNGGDGCSTACTVEAGWACTGQPSACTPI